MGDVWMIDVAGDSRRRRRLLTATAAAVVALAGVVAVGVIAPRSAAAQDDPLPSAAFVARAGEFADALAASAVAGQLGAPLFLTPSNELSATTASALTSVEPELVVLAGGEAALSSTVEQQVRDAVPAAEVDRRGGATRIDTAVALADLAEDLGFDRPVLTGATVEGTAGVGGLEVDGQPVTGGGDSDLESRVAALESDLADAESRIAELEATLAGVVRTTDADDNDTLQFEGMNVQVVNGTGTTDGEPNGVGNLIVGYNEDRTCEAAPLGDSDCPDLSDETEDDRTGSHMLVTGIDHTYTTFGGLLAGLNNTISSAWATVSGGGANTASGLVASVSGGVDNTASHFGASVSGGASNTASQLAASVSGGGGNTANADSASVSGGASNTASDSGASVSGGTGNTASGPGASVSGGENNEASDEGASVSGGHSNSADDSWTTVAGGHGGVITEVAGNDYDSLIADTLFDDAP